MKKQKPKREVRRPYPNVIECLECGMILVSFNRHDYKTCSCRNETFIDGGSDYLRCGGINLDKVKVLKIISAQKMYKVMRKK